MTKWNIFENYAILQKKLNSNQTILIHRQSKNKIVMKEIQLASQQQYKGMIQCLQIQKSIRNPYIISLIDYHATANRIGKSGVQNLNSNGRSPLPFRSISPKPTRQNIQVKTRREYRIDLFYEQPHHTLRQQIISRVQTKTIFDQSQIWNILYSVCIGLSCLQQSGISHGCITTDDIYLNQDGMVRIIDPSLTTSKPLKQFVSGYYYAPELLALFDSHHQAPSKHNINILEQIDVFKCDVFSLSMCILECCLLQNCSQFYVKKYQYSNYENFNNLYKQQQHILFSINTEKLRYKFSTIIPYFSEQLLNLLYYGLALDKQARFDFISLQKQISLILGPSLDDKQMRFSLGRGQCISKAIQNLKYQTTQRFEAIKQSIKPLPSPSDLQDDSDQLFLIQFFRLDQEIIDVIDYPKYKMQDRQQNTQKNKQLKMGAKNQRKQCKKQNKSRQNLIINLQNFLFRQQNKLHKNLQKQLNQQTKQNVVFQDEESFGELFRNELNKSNNCLNFKVSDKQWKNKKCSINSNNQSSILQTIQNQQQDMSFDILLKQNNLKQLNNQKCQYSQNNDEQIIEQNKEQRRQNIQIQSNQRQCNRQKPKQKEENNLTNISLASVKMIQSQTSKPNEIEVRFKYHQQNGQQNIYNKRDDRDQISQNYCARENVQIYTDPKLLQIMRIDMQRILAKKIQTKKHT